MVLPGHIAGGYLVTEILLSSLALPFTANEINALYILGTISGEMPDIDLLFFYLKNKRNKITKISKNETHRKYITHIPIFWLIVAIIISIIGLILQSKFLIILGPIIFLGTISHLILDSIEYGIVWLYPFNKKRFTILKTKLFFEEDKKNKTTIGSFFYYWDYVKKIYPKQITFYIEILITIIAIIIFFR